MAHAALLDRRRRAGQAVREDAGRAKVPRVGRPRSHRADHLRAGEGRAGDLLDRGGDDSVDRRGRSDPLVDERRHVDPRIADDTDQRIARRLTGLVRKDAAVHRRLHRGRQDVVLRRPLQHRRHARRANERVVRAIVAEDALVFRAKAGRGLRRSLERSRERRLLPRRGCGEPARDLRKHARRETVLADLHDGTGDRERRIVTWLRDGRVTAASLRDEAIALVALLRDTDPDELDPLELVARDDRATFVERDLGIEDVAPMREQPLHAGEAALLLVGGQCEDHVARERRLLSRQREHRRGEGGGHRLVVTDPAAPEKAVLLRRDERRHRPRLALDGYDVDVREQEERSLRAVALQPRDQVAASRRRLDDLGRHAGLLQLLCDRPQGVRLAPAARVDGHELDQQSVRFLLERTRCRQHRTARRNGRRGARDGGARCGPAARSRRENERRKEQPSHGAHPTARRRRGRNAAALLRTPVAGASSPCQSSADIRSATGPPRADASCDVHTMRPPRRSRFARSRNRHTAARSALPTQHHRPRRHRPVATSVRARSRRVHQARLRAGLQPRRP